ncbi:phosphatidylinositol-specific phospholipase C domain-containing protein [Bacillus albus]|uniref:phosphatidylinositol-specific phospholipase C domain-containing protein n=1 Tax=Bacillus albus TaxID=2026189 RepID=UPI001020FCAE|nr:phosphatidylinositol-specific phospholipase C domain-containing protein [Bacillus albus]
MTLGNFLDNGKSNKQNNLEELEIRELLLPLQNSKERTEAITHIMVYYTSNMDKNPQDPYNVNDIYNRLRDKGLSTHYMIDRNGTIFNLTNENRVAFHANKDTIPSYPSVLQANSEKIEQGAIGIELLGIRTGDEMKDLTNEQYHSFGSLLGDIYKRNPSIMGKGDFGKSFPIDGNGAGRPFAYSHDSAQHTYNPNWMKDIKDTAKLSELSIPGTHDSMAYKTLVPGTDHVYTQSMSLEKQLNSGIRFLDMRCKVQKGIFWMYHGPYYLDNKFDFVLDRVTKFLKENPSETILMRVKQEADKGANDRVEDVEFDEIFKKYMDKFPTFFWDSKGGSIDNPTLGEMRGKIVILRDFYCSDIGLTYDYKFDTQDNYKVYSNWGLYKKWKDVKDHLRKAQQAYPNKVGKPLINYLSGSTGDEWLVYPYFVASGHSSPGNSAPRLATGFATPFFSDKYPDFPRVSCLNLGFIKFCTIAFEGTNILATNYIEENDLKYTGIVVSDFPGPDLIESVIKVNYRLKESRIPDGIYKIFTPLGASKVLTQQHPFTPISLWDEFDTDYQKWKFVYDEEEGAYQIQSVSDPDLVLVWIDVSSAPTYKKVMVHKNEHKEEHYWILEETNDGYYIIKSKKNRVLVFDVDGASPKTGTHIKVEKRHRGNPEENQGLFAAQKFKIEKV